MAYYINQHEQQYYNQPIRNPQSQVVPRGAAAPPPPPAFFGNAHPHHQYPDNYLQFPQSQYYAPQKQMIQSHSDYLDHPHSNSGVQQSRVSTAASLSQASMRQNNQFYPIPQPHHHLERSQQYDQFHDHHRHQFYEQYHQQQLFQPQIENNYVISRPSPRTYILPKKISEDVSTSAKAPPPFVPTMQVFNPQVPVTSWHPVESRYDKEDKELKYINPMFSSQANAKAVIELEKAAAAERERKQKQEEAEAEKQKKRLNRKGSLDHFNEQGGDTSREGSQVSSQQYFSRSQIRQATKKEVGQRAFEVQKSLFQLEQIEDEAEYENSSMMSDNSDLRFESLMNKSRNVNRFELLFNYDQINKDHENLFEDDHYKSDMVMSDVLGPHKIKVAPYPLQENPNGTVPSLVWKSRGELENDSFTNLPGERTKKSRGGVIDEDEEEEYDEYNRTGKRNALNMESQLMNQEQSDSRYNLWEVRYHKLDEEDYLVGYSNNIFSRKSNYLRIGLFFKQAYIRFQYDKSKEIVCYYYSYDEYAIRKKQSEILEEESRIMNEAPNASSFNFIDDEDLNNNNSRQQQNRNLRPQHMQNGSGLSDQKGYSSRNIKDGGTMRNINNSQGSNSQIGLSYMKNRIQTNTTINNSTVKTKVNEKFDFSKSNYMRDYEKSLGLEKANETIQEEENEGDGDEMNSKYQSANQSMINQSQSANFSKLFQNKPARERKKVIERKQDDLSQVNKYKVWEKNAVSEDAFLDQVRDTTIEAVKRARNLEEIIIEKNSVFEHHAAQLLNQHLFQLRKVSREYKAELYRQVKEKIQTIYDEYLEIIGFENKNTFVMLVCDKKDHDRILGLHYQGYQSRKYFEKYFDEFVTFNKTRSEFEKTRFQAHLLNPTQSKKCQRYFIDIN